MENEELISYLQTLEKDISGLTSSSVAKERETLRRDLEKVKSKLKEAEAKLKIAVQEKTKLEVVSALSNFLFFFLSFNDMFLLYQKIFCFIIRY